MKRLISVLLAVIVLAACVMSVGAATVGQINAADAMNELGLFLGTGRGYELNSQLTRAQGITMLVRMIGKEAEAKNTDYGDPFTDVPAWADGYVGYAWKNKITNGVAADRFDPNATMTDYMFLTLTLRALGYDDGNGDFVWNKPYALAVSAGLIGSAAPDSNFTRGEAVEVFWNAMNAKLKDTTTTLAQSLIGQGVFTAAEFDDAADVQTNGREEGSGKPLGSADKTPQEKPDTDTDAETNTGTGTNTNTGTNTGTGGNTETDTDTKPDTDSAVVTYEDYEAMNGAEQEAFFNSFRDPADFFEWYNDAKAKYDAENPKIEIDGSGSVDLGEIAGG